MTEVALALVILKLNGIPLRPQSQASVTNHLMKLLEVSKRRSTPSLVNASASARLNVYVEGICSSRTRGDAGGLFVNYHTVLPSSSLFCILVQLLNY
jgi:hypothetical protein